jgi:hypothetical protein
MDQLDSRKPHSDLSIPPRHLLLATLLIVGGLPAWLAWNAQVVEEQEGVLIGPITTVTELTTGLAMEARVDTGATSCSLHCEEQTIIDAAEDPADNIGKTVRCLLRNNRDETAWLEATIVDHNGVRTTTKLDDRYFVELPIRVDGFEEVVRVSLNDRTKMKYPFLLGRNYLRDRFVVDVSLDRQKDQL